MIIEILKKGSGIHIKPENRGKFTKYCNGKVTSECIARGKRSSDPAIRKRATFADNARHFKHRSGGLITKILNGTKLGQFLNSDTGQSIINGIGTGILYFATNNLLNKQQDEFNKAIKAKYKLLKNNIDNKAINSLAILNIEVLLYLNPELNFGLLDLLQEQEKLKKMLLLNLNKMLNSRYNRISSSLMN